MSVDINLCTEVAFRLPARREQLKRFFFFFKKDTHLASSEAHIMKQKLIYSNVRGCKATTMVPLTIPSPFNRIHRPRRCSCPIPATRRITFDEDAEFRCAMASSPLGWGHAHEVGGKASWGADISWRELTTPGAGTVPMRVNDLSFGSSFHNRISPSQEPGSAQP